MRLAIASDVAERIRVARPDVTVFAALFDGTAGYIVPVAMADGRRDEIRRPRDVERLVPVTRRKS